MNQIQSRMGNTEEFSKVEMTKATEKRVVWMEVGTLLFDHSCMKYNQTFFILFNIIQYIVSFHLHFLSSTQQVEKWTKINKKIK